MSKGLKVGLLAGTIVLVLAIGTAVFLRQRGRAPSAILVRETVEKLIGNPQLKITGVASTVTPDADPGHAMIAYRADTEVRESLYEPAEPTALFRDELKLDPAAWQQTRKVLSGKTAPRILELAGLQGLDPTLLQSTFLHQTTAPGAKLSFTGKLRAVKGNAGWQLTGERPTLGAGAARGQPRNAFAGSITLVDDAAAMQKIRGLAAAQADVPAKIEAGRLAFLEERHAAQEKIVADLVDSLKPGTVYAGTATADSGAPVKIFLEFTDANARSKRVTAVLRNDGSWSDQRALTGSYAFDADSEILNVTLATAAQQAVPDAGELLADAEDWQVGLQLVGGKLSGHEHGHRFALNRLSEAEAAAARKEIEAASVALLEATATGKIYHGVARSRATPATFDYLLRFTAQDRAVATGVATLGPAGSPGGQRIYHATLTTNRHRPGGPALHLASQANAAVKSSDSHSPIALDRDDAFSLKLVDGRLQGETTDFSFDFSPLSEADIAKLAAAAAEREQALLAIVKPDTAYPGTARLETISLTEKVRLRFRRVDAHGSDVDAVIESLDQSGVFREFRGSVDAFASQLTLTSVGKGRAAAGRKAGLKFPPLAYSDEQLLILDLNATALSGELQGSGQGWKLNFPVADATAVAGNAAENYPTETGAYVWRENTWQPLPRNEAKINKSAFKAIGGFFSSLGKKSNSPATAEKLSDLVFTGHDPVPRVGGTAVRLLYVGPLKNDVVEKYPQLSSYPEIEIAPTTHDSNGSRKAVLSRLAEGVPVGGFGDRRVPAKVERASETVLELSCTQQLAPGSYAISVNGEGFELDVE